MVLPITLTIAGAAALLNIWLGWRVSQLRLRHKVSIGDEGNAQVTARMRAHANYAEYTPFFLILLGLIELAVGSPLWLWGIAIVYVLARIAHAFGMDRGRGPNPLRVGGVAVSWAALIALAAAAIWLAAQAPRPVKGIEAPAVRTASL